MAINGVLKIHYSQTTAASASAKIKFAEWNVQTYSLINKLIAVANKQRSGL